MNIQKWEYLVVRMARGAIKTGEICALVPGKQELRPLNEVLDSLGTEGWELVAVATAGFDLNIEWELGAVATAGLFDFRIVGSSRGSADCSNWLIFKRPIEQ